MARWLWYFWIYSFLGWGLEKGFAAVTRAENQQRKCFLFLPLCPVYGLGMLAVLALPPELSRGGWLIVSGGLAATAVEYAVHWGYEALLGVRFWDYSHVPGNWNGPGVPALHPGLGRADRGGGVGCSSRRRGPGGPDPGRR